jgi:hypothetical protein
LDKELRPANYIGRPGFVFDRHEHDALGRTRLLAQQDQTSSVAAAAIACIHPVDPLDHFRASVLPLRMEPTNSAYRISMVFPS